jgi:hypothetical protein
MMTDEELFETITENPAEKWRQKSIGSISVNNNADIVIAKTDINKGFDAFYSINPEDILLVLHQGEMRLFSEEIKNQLISYRFPISQFSKINLNEKVKFVYGNLSALVNEILLYNPKTHFAITVE